MTKDDFIDFAKISLSTYDLEGLNMDVSLAQNNLAEELYEEFELLNTEEVKKKRLAFFQIPNTRVDDYKEHLLSIPGKGKIIYGIRHYDRQKDVAFISILTNFQTSKKELLEIYHQYLRKDFLPFAPKYLNYHSKQFFSNNQLGSCYSVQQASIIKKRSKHKGEKDLELLTPKDANYYEWYAEEYRQFHNSNKELKNSVPCNALELMEESRGEGLLKEVFLNNESIGLIAAQRSRFFGRESIYFIEILIKKAWRGQGLAKAVQRKFIEALADDTDIVWGTISMKNKASLSTAKSNLRKAIRFENFIEIDLPS